MSHSYLPDPAPQRPAPNRIVRRPVVLELTGLSTSTLYAMMACGDFPRPVRLGKRAVGWHERDVREWLESREKAVS